VIADWLNINQPTNCACALTPPKDSTPTTVPSGSGSRSACLFTSSIALYADALFASLFTLSNNYLQVARAGEPFLPFPRHLLFTASRRPPDGPCLLNQSQPQSSIPLSSLPPTRLSPASSFQTTSYSSSAQHGCPICAGGHFLSWYVTVLGPCQHYPTNLIVCRCQNSRRCRSTIETGRGEQLCESANA
jgi:hypothetical protein